LEQGSEHDLGVDEVLGTAEGHDAHTARSAGFLRSGHWVATLSEAPAPRRERGRGSGRPRPLIGFLWPRASRGEVEKRSSDRALTGP